MSTQAIEQMGKTGALYQLIKMEAEAQDTGLVTLKGIHSKIIRLLLTNDGDFSKKLENSSKNTKS